MRPSQRPWGVSNGPLSSTTSCNPHRPNLSGHLTGLGMHRAPRTTGHSEMMVDSTKAFELKGRMTTVTFFHLFIADTEAVTQQLDDALARAPGLLQEMPIVLNLSALPALPSITLLSALLSELRRRGIRPIAIQRGPWDELDTLIKAQGLGLWPDPRQASSRQPAAGATTAPPEPASDTPRSAAPAKSAEILASGGAEAIDRSNHDAGGDGRVSKGGTTQVIARPIRSGQQVYARRGDLVILGAVSPGAEVMADGHIHLYGPLRGRALAGVAGDETARIFCRSLRAELVAIAGQYRVSEDIPPNDPSQAVQVYLQDGQLRIDAL